MQKNMQLMHDMCTGTIAEGGAQFGSAMPAFKDVLSRDDIWAVIAYIQARLPQKAK